MPDTLPPSRPSTRFKLAALSALGVAMVALPLAQVLRYQGAELQAALAEQAGLDPVARAVAVQHGLLAHRDVAGRVLRGQLGLEPERLSRQGEVDEKVARLASALVVVATDRAIEESSALREDWALLVRQVQQRNITAPESDLGHRLLVEQTLQVIDLVADASGLGRDHDADTALLASVMTRSLPRLAAEIATLASPGIDPEHRADERQLAATEAALARSLGRLNETIERSAVPGALLAAATAEAGAAADRYFNLLRGQPNDDIGAAGEAALQAQFRLLGATHDVVRDTLSRRVSGAQRARDALVATMAVLALLALGLARRVFAAPAPPGTRQRAEAAPPQAGTTRAAAGGAVAAERRGVVPRGTSSRDETGRLLHRLRESSDRGPAPLKSRSHAETLPPDEP